MWRFLKKLRMDRPYDPAISLLTVYPKETKTRSERYLHSNVCATLFTITKIWKQSKCLSMDEWIKKMWYIYNGI